MSQKQVLTLWVIAGILTVALFAVRANISKSPESVTKFERGDKLAADLPTKKIAKVVISDPDHTTTLAKGEKEWTIAERQDYAANFTKLTTAIGALTEIEVAHSLEAGPTYNPRFGMDDSATEAGDHGTRVKLLDSSDKELFSLTLGKGASVDQQSRAGGRYLRTSEDPDSVYVIAQQLSELSANPAAWLADGFFKIEGIKSITLRSLGAIKIEPWTVTRDDATSDFTLEGLGDKEEMVTATASALKNIFNNARFEDVVTGEHAKSNGNPDKTQQAVINTFDGFTYSLTLTPKKTPEEAEADDFNPSAENYFLTFTVDAKIPEERTKAEDETEEEAKAADEAFAARKKSLEEKLATEQGYQGRTYEIAKWGTSALLKERNDLVQKKEDEAASQPSGTPSAVSPPIQIPMARSPE